MTQKYSTSRFGRFATWASHTTGHPSTFIVAVLIILAWVVTGPMLQ